MDKTKLLLNVDLFIKYKFVGLQWYIRMIGISTCYDLLDKINHPLFIRQGMPPYLIISIFREFDSIKNNQNLIDLFYALKPGYATINVFEKILETKTNNTLLSQSRY